MTFRSVSVETGLHGKVATSFIKKAEEFGCLLWVEKGDRRVNGKSLLGILSLFIVKGSEICLVADGKDEDKAIEALANIIT